MTKRRAALLAACGAVTLILGGSRLLLAQQASLPIPDSQTLILENAFVRVFDIRLAPGKAEAKHRHARGLTIAMSDYDNETRADGTMPWSAAVHTAAGTVRWAEPVVHEARNTGTTEQHVVRIELK